MSNVFEQWDAMVDIAGLQKDIAEAAANGGGDYKEVPMGKYEVKVEKLELTETKESHKPMVSVWFKVVAGDFEGGMIFMNQVITEGFQIHIVNEFLRALTSAMENAPLIEFCSYSQYNNLLMDIFEVIDGNFEYALDYGQNKKGYNTFKIEEVFVFE